jgi:hypothetical protein
MINAIHFGISVLYGLAIKNNEAYESPVPLLGIYPREMKPYVPIKTRPRIFIAVFITAKW